MPQGFIKIERYAKVKKITTWGKYVELINKHKKSMPNKNEVWAFRGQTHDDPLTTNLERALIAAGRTVKDAPEYEEKIIREFRRRFAGDDRQLVKEDTLYALSIMQHHGAPTRLLDWSYSPFVAAFFALEGGYKKVSPVVWALDHKSLRTLNECKKLLVDRNNDVTRNDKSFKLLYFPESNPRKFVFSENPYHLNSRLIIQQGVFLCQGDVASSFINNLKNVLPRARISKKSFVKFKFKLVKQEWELAMSELLRMNINRATLFPGLDGFCSSLRHKMIVL